MKAYTPKVSIVVPCWGVEKYLDRCVESLVNQTLKDIEIILVDDESPDRVPEMCDDWAKKDSRIKVIHKKNGGLGMACNSGLEAANGEYVAFCDSDDWVDDNTYDTMYQNAIASDVDLVMTSFKYVDLEGRLLSKPSLSYISRLYCDTEIKEMMKGMIASSPSCSKERLFHASAKVTLYKNSIIKNNSLQFVSERIVPSEDLVFNLDYLSHCRRVLTLSEKFYNYRINPKSISRSINKDTFFISKNLYKFLIGKVDDLSLGTDGAHRVQRMFIGTTRATVAKVFKSNIPFQRKQKMIHEIGEDKLLKQVYCSYPLNIMPIKHRVFLYATIREILPLLYLMSKVMH